LEFWKANPSFAFLAVATRKGDLVDRRGLVYGGHHSAGSHRTAIVQREIDLRETAKSLADDQKLHDDQKAAIRHAGGAPWPRRSRPWSSVARECWRSRRPWRPCRPSNAVRSVSVEDVGNRLRRMESELTTLEQTRNEAHGALGKKPRPDWPRRR